MLMKYINEVEIMSDLDLHRWEPQGVPGDEFYLWLVKPGAASAEGRPWARRVL